MTASPLRWYDIDLRWAYGDLLGSIYRRTRSLDRSYDVLHDALIRFALLNRRDPIHQPHAYLRTVVNSVLSRHGEDIARWMPYPDSDDLLDEAHPDLIETRKLLDERGDMLCFAPPPDHIIYLRERLRSLQRILDCLPPRCREVFWLCRIEGLSPTEIGEQLGISPKTVGYHLSRALADMAPAARDL